MLGVLKSWLFVALPNFRVVRSGGAVGGASDGAAKCCFGGCCWRCYSTIVGMLFAIWLLCRCNLFQRSREALGPMIGFAQVEKTGKFSSGAQKAVADLTSEMISKAG